MFTSSTASSAVSSFTEASPRNRSSAVRTSSITGLGLHKLILTGPTASGRDCHAAWSCLCPSGTAGLSARAPRGPRTHWTISKAPSPSSPPSTFCFVHDRDKGEEQKTPKQSWQHGLKLLAKPVKIKCKKTFLRKDPTIDRRSRRIGHICTIIRDRGAKGRYIY